MPEELAVDGPLRNGTTVHSDVGAVLPCTEGMDDLGHHLLAGAALARDQYAEVRGSHLRGDLNGPVETRRGADDAETLFDGLNVHAFTRDPSMMEWK